jgi:hypothetical protein
METLAEVHERQVAEAMEQAFVAYFPAVSLRASANCLDDIAAGQTQNDSDPIGVSLER